MSILQSNLLYQCCLYVVARKWVGMAILGETFREISINIRHSINAQIQKIGSFLFKIA